ncbi:hypothetical protein ACFL5Y_02035, partial [Candidatus Omnitrophota bacterium]
MLRKTFLVYLVLSVFAINSSYAQETVSKQAAPQKQEASQKTEVSQKKEKITVSQEIVKKDFPSYNYTLKQLIAEADKNLKKVNFELQGKETEEEARKHFDEGNRLYKEGELAAAKKEWQKALKLTDDPQMKKYIRGSEKKAKQAQDQQKRQELEQKRAEKKQQEALEKQKRAQEKAQLKAQKDAQRQKEKLERQKKLA